MSRRFGAIRLVPTILALSLTLSGMGHSTGIQTANSGLLKSILGETRIVALPIGGTVLPSRFSLADEVQGSTEPVLQGAAGTLGEAEATAPADAEYGINRDHVIEGGEVVGESVNLLNGNVVERRLDLRFSSPNRLGLTFEAFYNSRSPGAGSCGYGWRHNYSPRLSLPGTSPYHKVVDATGRSHYFRKSGGVYAGVYQEKTRLESTEDGFLWRPLDGSRYRFSATGLLIWIEDQVGNRLTLGYSAGKLATVTDGASGRSLTFVYTDGLLTRIDGPASQAVPGGTGWVRLAYTGQDLTSVTYADGSGYKYNYDATTPHKLVEVRDREGNPGHLLKTWKYDESNRCVSATTRHGKGVSSINYVSGNSVTVTDAYGKARTYTISSFGGRGRVTSVSIPNAPYRPDNAVGFTYDALARLTQVGYGGGRVDRFSAFNPRGLPGKVEFAYGSQQPRSVTCTWHPEMDVLLSRSEASVLNPAQSKVSTFDYDNPGASGDDPNVYNENPSRLLRRKIEQGYTRNAAGVNIPHKVVTSYSYDTKGQITRISGPIALSGYRTDFAYSPGTFDLTTITRPIIGATTLSNYEPAGFPRLLTDVNSRSTAFTYDGRGRVTRVRNTDGGVRSLVINAGGGIQSTTDEDNVKFSYSYATSSGLLTRVSEYSGGATGDYVQHTRDPRGNITRTDWVERETGDVTRTKSWSYMHPAYPGLLWKEIEPQTAENPFGTTLYDYYPSGMVKSRTDATGAVTGYEYDIFNRLRRVTEPSGTATDLTRDAHGNIRTLKDAKASMVTYVWDDLGRLVSETTPDSGNTTYGYDPAGNLIRKTDAMGVTVTYTYDLLDRLTKASYPASGTQPAYTLVYTYDEAARPDGKGRLTSVTDPSGGTRLAYDERGRLKSKTSTIVKNGTQSTSFNMSREFTAGGRVTRITYPSGRTLDFERSQCPCRVSRISTSRGGVTKDLMDISAYRPFGDPSTMGIGAPGNHADVNSAFNQRGELESVNTGARLERTFTYTQDGLLATVAAPNVPRHNRSFLYDGLKRLEHATGPFGQLDYSYDPVGNRLTETANAVSTAYSHVPGTNRLSSVGSATYGYDNCGRITRAGVWTYAYNQGGQFIQARQSGTLKGTYLYNAFGQRAKKTTTSATSFVYDFDGNLAAEANANGAVTAEYLYRGKQRLARATGSAIHFYHNNELGTLEIMTDENNRIVWEAIHKPFGEAKVNTKSTLVNNFRFQGQYYDQETGLHYNWHRTYDPKTGRYLTPDPIGLAGGINPYLYVLNDPVNSIDPDGQLPIIPMIIGAALFAGSQSTSFQDAAADAAQYWANKQVETGNWLYGIPGALATLAAPCNARTTATILGVGSAAGAYLGRPFWQYYPVDNAGYSSSWMTRGWGWNAPYQTGAEAAERLALPPWNPGTGVRPVSPSPFQYVAGPRPVVPQPQWWRIGGGVEYKLGGF